MIGDQEYIPIEIGSRTLKKAIYNLDEDLVRLENDNAYFKKENKRLEKLVSDQLHATMQAQQASMAATLAACISTPDLTSLGTVGATVLVRIKEMDNIEDVHKYISEIINKEKNNKEKKSLKNRDWVN